MSHCIGCPRSHCPAVAPTLNCIDGRSDLMIIGEGPGVQEVRAGKGFQGPSGQLLRQALIAAGYTKDMIVSLNYATLCVPPTEGKQTALPKMVDSCRSRLLADIEQANPKVILALGRYAMQAMTGKPVKITNVSGMPRQWKGRWLVPGIHPASVLRHGNDMSVFQAAVNAAMRLVLGGEENEPPGEPKYFFAGDLDKVKAVVSSLFKMAERGEGPILGCDIETTGLDPLSDEVLLLGICWAPGKVIIFPKQFVFSYEVRALMESNAFKFVWHNGKFDIGFLRAQGMPISRVDDDTMLMHYCLDEQKGTHDLEQVASAYLGVPDYKSEVSSYAKKGWKGAPPKLMLQYLARDCSHTRALYFALEKELGRDSDLMRLYRGLLIPASDLLTEVSANGFWVNPDAVEEARQDLLPKPEEERQRAIDLSGVEGLNPGAPGQVAKVITEQFKRNLYGATRKAGKRKESKETTEESVILYLHGTSHSEREKDFYTALLNFRGARKLLSTYVDGIAEQLGTDGRIHGTYLLHGTVTGRLASRNPNMQNIPRISSIRGQFQAPPGRILLETDLDQAELRVLANLSGDPGFIEIYQQGRKLHHEMATEMYGPNFTQEQYIRAKAVNFGIAYGRGAESFVKEFGEGNPSIPKEQQIDLAEAQRIVSEWFKRFPKAYEWVQSIRAMEIGEEKILRSPTGRARRFKMISKENIHECRNEASNFPIQSTASDITLLTGIGMRHQAKELNALIVNLVHDSIIYEIPDDLEVAKVLATSTAALFKKVGAELVGDAVPFTAEFKIGNKWGSLEKFKF